MHEKLTDNNFVLYCARHYNVKYNYCTEEFYEDIKRIGYIKKLITRYIQTGDLKERLILNHIIILNNVFGPVVTCRILFLKLEKQMKYVKPFLVMLNILPEKLYYINCIDIIDTDCIEMDTGVIEALRKI